MEYSSNIEKDPLVRAMSEVQLKDRKRSMVRAMCGVQLKDRKRSMVRAMSIEKDLSCTAQR